MAGAKSGSGGKRAGYKLATYRSSEGPRAGLVVGDEVFDAAKLSGKSAYSSVLAILEDWKTAEGVLKAAAAKAGKSKIKRQPVKRTKFLAPVQYPSAIFCAHEPSLRPTTRPKWPLARAVRRRPIHIPRD